MIPSTPHQQDMPHVVFLIIFNNAELAFLSVTYCACNAICLNSKHPFLVFSCNKRTHVVTKIFAHFHAFAKQ